MREHSASRFEYIIVLVRYRMPKGAGAGAGAGACVTAPYGRRVVNADHRAQLCKYFPETPALKTPATLGDARKVHVTLTDLKPSTRIFYFGTMPSHDVKPRDQAYGHLENSGVAAVSADGSVSVSINCPGVYTSESHTDPRHMHFVYWNAKHNSWGNKVYTHTLFCPVTSARVHKAVVSEDALVIDALPNSYYDERHIRYAINIPHDSPANDIWKTLRGTPKSYPIIIYCYSATCDAAEHLKTRLDKLGYTNTWHYAPGITGWRGPVDR